jgi:hypothetical protein
MKGNFITFGCKFTGVKEQIRNAPLKDFIFKDISSKICYHKIFSESRMQFVLAGTVFVSVMSAAVGLRCWHTASSITQPRAIYNARSPSVWTMYFIPTT